MATGKVCPTDSDFFGISRSTRCGCDRKHYCKTLWSLERSRVTYCYSTFLFHYYYSYYYYYSSTHFCPLDFSEMPWSNFMKPCSNIICHVKFKMVCRTDFDFFYLSRSTSCGCCSYQVSSISVWRVTCYDHFCVFQFFSILAVSMAMVAISWTNFAAVAMETKKGWFKIILDSFHETL
jgi:hypothetical protein